jgi:hypothetical protein
MIKYSIVTAFFSLMLVISAGAQETVKRRSTMSPPKSVERQPLPRLWLMQVRLP